MKHFCVKISAIVAMGLVLTACTNPYDPAQRALGGAAIGAGTGAAIGAVAGGGHGAAIGALAGGAVGAVTGAATTPPPPGAYSAPYSQPGPYYGAQQPYYPPPGATYAPGYAYGPGYALGYPQRPYVAAGYYAAPYYAPGYIAPSFCRWPGALGC